MKAIVQGLRGLEEEEEEEEEGEEDTVIEDDDVEGEAVADTAGGVVMSIEGPVVMGHLVEGPVTEGLLVKGHVAEGQPHDQSSPKTTSSSSPRKTIAPAVVPPPPPTVKLEDLQPVFVPDRGGVLHASSFLTVDDAPWISAALARGKGNNNNNKVSGGAGTLNFVHSLVDPQDALLLGAKSLREQLFSGDDIVCPEPLQLKTLLGNDAVTDVLFDLLALADTLQAAAVHVLYDERTHLSESLMHPGLAEAQGPALTFFIENPQVRQQRRNNMYTSMIHTQTHTHLIVI